MQNSESNPGLPSFGRNYHLTSSIAPFKPSLGKNPSYFSLIRSPEVLLEKKKLKEENWKLKQMLHSLNEENLKLKQKLLQKSETNRLVLNDGIQVTNQHKYIDILEESLRGIKNELTKKKQENAELKKRIYKAKDEKLQEIQKNISSRHSLNSEKLDRQRESNEKAIAELSKSLSYLKSELKIISEENAVLESEKEKTRLLVEQLELNQKNPTTLSVVSENSIGISLQKQIMHMKSRVSSLNSMEIIPERVLKRESLKNDQATLVRFFRNLFTNIQMLKLRSSEIANYVKNLEDPDFTLEVFLEVLSKFAIKLRTTEVQEVFEIISNKESMNIDEFLSVFHEYSEQLDSDKSSDISSGSSEVEKIVITIKKDPDEHLHMIIDNIAFKLLESGIGKEFFEALCKEKLPDCVNLLSLCKFLYESADFISKEADKRKIAVNLMEGQETITKHLAIQKIISAFFPFGKLKKKESEFTKSVLNKVSKKADFFLKKFQELDTKKIGFLSWDKIYQVLYDSNVILLEETEDFKYHCYLLSNSLKKINFSLLFEELNSES